MRWERVGPRESPVWGEQSLPDQFRFRLVMWERAQYRKDWHPPASCTVEKFYIGKMVIVSIVLNLKPHNSIFSYISLKPLELLSLCWSLG